VIDGVVAKLAWAGEVAGYDRRRLAREQRSAEAKLAETRAALERGRARLAGLIGRDIGDDLAGPLLPAAPPPLPESCRRKLAARPEFAALAARAEAAQSDSAAAQQPSGTDPRRRRKRSKMARCATTATRHAVLFPAAVRPPAGRAGAARRKRWPRAPNSAWRGSRPKANCSACIARPRKLIAAAMRYRREAVAPSAELLRIAESAYRAGESTVLELLDAYKGALEAEPPPSTSNGRPAPRASNSTN
jgi:cobalt-zinc-cadmium efflux system outer membrane protein